jgi:predicted AAA+ superfamily ATPase
MNNDALAILYKYNFWEGQAITFGHLRPSYLKKLCEYMGNPLVKVILGQRRVGKSRLLRMLISQLISVDKVPASNILYINKELHEFDFIQDSMALLQLIQFYRDTLQPVGKVYVLIDEVQEIHNWEKAVNSLSQNHAVETEVIITGSNANLLSGELASFLSGRYLTLTVYPFGYEEYLQVFNLSRSKESVLQYLQDGGMPELYQLTGEEAKKNYVQSLLDSIVLRDIVSRNKIRDVYLLEKMIHFIIDSIGSMVSVPSIVKTLQQFGFKSNPETMGNYLTFCQKAFFLHECPRYDIRGKQILVGEKRYYLNDLIFKTIYQSGFEMKTSRLLENVVYLSLLRQGYQVFVGRYGNQEIDFVAEKQGEKLYIQVAYVLPDEAVIQREFGNLLLIQDNYPKWVVSLDEVPIGNIEGVLHKPIWEVLC